jgi:hypothetical protein
MHNLQRLHVPDPNEPAYVPPPVPPQPTRLAPPPPPIDDPRAPGNPEIPVYKPPSGDAAGIALAQRGEVSRPLNRPGE